MHQIEHFIKVIQGEVLPLVSARDGLLNLLVTEAIAEAARTGQIVNLQVSYIAHQNLNFGEKI